MTSSNNTSQNTKADVSPQRYIIGLIVAHTILVLFAVLTFAGSFADYKWPRWQSIFIEALATGQVALLSASLVIGTVVFSVRMIALAIVLTFWLIVLNDLGLEQEQWLTVFAIQASGISFCLVIMRFFGSRLIREHGAGEVPLDQAAYRFSLRQMLYWTAAVSFMLCLGTVVSHYLGFNKFFDLGLFPKAATLGYCLFSVALVAVWATLGTNRKMTPFFFFVLVTVVASLIIAKADRQYRTTWWNSLTHESYQTAYMLLVYVYAILVYLSLTVIRACGYRFAKRSRNV